MVARWKSALAEFHLCGAGSSRLKPSRTSENVVVREAEPSDAAAIAHVRGRTWRAAYAHIFAREQLDTISEERDAPGWERHLSAPPPKAATFVAARDDLVVGFSGVGLARPGDEPSLGELFTIYVLPDEWGQGVGRALMERALERMRAEGFEKAILWVLEDNPRTRGFYELAGWQADGEVKEEEWLGSVVREVRYRIDLR
jgi:ribosomal protein S18 acetylase RimI-like enzyme